MNKIFSRFTTLTAAAVLLGVSTTVPAQTDDHAAHHPEQAEAAPEPGPGMGRGMMGGMHDRMEGRMHDRMEGRMHDRMEGRMHDRMEGRMHDRMEGRGMMQGMHDRMGRGPERGGMMERGMMQCPMMQGMKGMRGRGMMQDGSGMMQGMMEHAMGPMGGMAMLHGLGPIGMLELDAEQRNEIRQMYSELRREHWDTLGQLLDERETLQALYAAEPRDPAAIGEAYERLSGLQRPLIEAMVEAGNRIEALLSEEQQEQLQQLRRGGRGSMGGMGMMGG